MANSKEVLSSILKTAQTGKVEIRSVLDTTMSSGIRSLLESQLREYDSIETQAYSLASQRGWELQELQPGRQFLTDRKIRMQLGFRNRESRIADMMIQNNTRGMISGLKLTNQWTNRDNQVGILSQKLLDCENANIRQLQIFL